MNMIRTWLLIGIVSVFSTSVGTAAVQTASTPVQPSASAAGASFDPQFSGDSQHIVFISHANNLVTNDNVSVWLDVFLRDLVTSDTVLVSVSTNGMSGANADAHSPSVSSNGQFVAFVSRAGNMVGGDTNAADDVFVRDVLNGATRLASVTSDGESPRDPQPALNIPLSGNPLISANGRWVFFESRATNLLSPPAPFGSVNIYGRDLWSNVTVLVTADTNGLPLAGTSILSSISEDGRFVAFISSNVSVHANVTNVSGDAYVRDVQNGTTVWASTNVGAAVGGVYSISAVTLTPDAAFALIDAGGKVVRQSLTDLSAAITVGNATKSPSQISADGRYVLYQSGPLHVFDCVGMTNQPVGWPSAQACGAIGLSDGSGAGSLSRDGRTVVFRILEGAICNDVVTPDYIFRRNLNTGETNIVVVTTNGSRFNAAGSFLSPILSPDGTRVAFSVDSAVLVSADFNSANDVFVADTSTAAVELISVAHTNRPPTTGVSLANFGPSSISADGKLIVFTRFDEAAAAGDENRLADVFLSDTSAGSSFALTIDTNLYLLDGASTPVALTNHTNAFLSAVISPSGTAVASTILQRNVNFGGTPGDILLFRASNGVFNTSSTLVTRDYQNNGFTRANTGQPSFSSDGELLVYQSTSQRLTADAYGGFPIATNVFVHHRRVVTNYSFTNIVMTNSLVSSTTNGSVASGSSVAPVISGDGRWISFLTTAGNIVAGNAATFMQWQCVVADIGTNRSAPNFVVNPLKRLVSYNLSFEPIIWTNASDPNLVHTNINAIFAPLSKDVTNCVFSGNQRFLFYALGDGSGVYRHDLAATHTNVIVITSSNGGQIVATNIVAGAANLLVCTNARNVSVNFDGTVVAFERLRGGTSNIFDIFCVDLTSGTESLVSASALGGLPNGTSTSPLINGNGRYVVFASKASDLIPNDHNGFSDIFIRDRQLGLTLLASANPLGQVGNGPSTTPVLSDNGGALAFRSYASDLAPGDYNAKRDIFVLRFGSADSDADGLDDDWELTYFNTLSRTGDGDFDNDGVTDGGEFLAGTDPTNTESYFRVLTVAPLAGGSTRVTWAGNPARTYRVEFKDGLNDDRWTPLDSSINWNGSVATATDATGTKMHRFYRAVRMP